MITRSSASVMAGGVLRTVSGGPPLTIRQVRHEDLRVCALCLVGSAAGPLAGDQTELSLELGRGARAVLTAAGANLAQGHVDDPRPGVLRTAVTLAEAASLHATSAPLIVSAGSSVSVSVSITVAATSSIFWREMLILGRTGEVAGSAVLRWTVLRGGRPLLVQSIDLSTGRDWPGMLDGNRVLASALISRPGLNARTIVDSPTAVCQQLDEQSVLITVLDTGAAAATACVDELIGALEGGQ